MVNYSNIQYLRNLVLNERNQATTHCILSIVFLKSTNKPDLFWCYYYMLVSPVTSGLGLV